MARKAPTKPQAKAPKKSKKQPARNSSYLLCMTGDADEVDNVIDEMRSSTLHESIIRRITRVHLYDRNEDLTADQEDALHDKFGDRADKIVDKICAHVRVRLEGYVQRAQTLVGDQEQVAKLIRALYRGEVNPDRVPDEYRILDVNEDDYQVLPSRVFIGLTYTVPDEYGRDPTGRVDERDVHTVTPQGIEDVPEYESQAIRKAIRTLLSTAVSGTDGFWDEKDDYYDPSYKDYDRVARQFAAGPLGFKSIQPSYRMRYHGMKLLKAEKPGEQAGFVFTAPKPKSKAPTGGEKKRELLALDPTGTYRLATGNRRSAVSFTSVYIHDKEYPEFPVFGAIGSQPVYGGVYVRVRPGYRWDGSNTDGAWLVWTGGVWQLLKGTTAGPVYTEAPLGTGADIVPIDSEAGAPAAPAKPSVADRQHAISQRLLAIGERRRPDARLEVKWIGSAAKGYTARLNQWDAPRKSWAAIAQKNGTLDEIATWIADNERRANG